MFRGNRIGTPVSIPTTDNSVTTVWAPSAAGIADLLKGNVINATPVLDFATSCIRVGVVTPQIPAFSIISLVQQFTVTAPLQGNVVGVEVSGGGFFPDIGNNCTIWPVAYKIDTAATTLLGAVQGGASCIFGNNGPDHPANQHTTNYKDQLLIDTTTGGTYAHGFAIYNTTNAAVAISYFRMNAFIRQLNDQQNIEYRDTRR